MCPMLKDLTVVNFISQQTKKMKPSTSLVVIEEVTLTSVRVLTVQAIHKKQVDT